MSREKASPRAGSREKSRHPAPCRCAGASRRIARAWARCLDAGVISFPTLLFLLSGKVSSERPGAVKGAQFGRGERTLDSEDRSETIRKGEKEELQLDSISEAQQAKRLHVYVATMVLSETRGL